MSRTTLPRTAAALAVMLLTSRLAIAEPPATNPIPLDARGFTASQALQAAYARSLEEKATKTKPATDKAPPAPAKAVEPAAPKSRTAVTVVSTPPGGTPPGSLRGLAPSSRTAQTVAAAPAGGNAQKQTAATGNSPSFTDRVRSMFSRGPGNSPRTPTDLPYLGK